MTTDPGREIVVSGPEALAEFRQGLTGRRLLELLDEAAGRLLVAIPVGVGKTELLVKAIIEAHADPDSYDLVIVLVPRRDIRAELVRRIPPDIPVVVLDRRPGRFCGERDAAWTEFEAAGCSLLARAELCTSCPRLRRCAWPGQLSRKRLASSRVILAAQHHLKLNPQFVPQLAHRAGARRPLTLLDESDLLVKSVRRSIRRIDLERYRRALDAALTDPQMATKAHRRHRDAVALLAEASTEDLQQGRWHFNPPDGEWAVAVQRAGRAASGPDFRFLGFELATFSRSDRASRERIESDIEFACPTDLGPAFVIFSGSIARDLARYRLDPDHRRPGLVSPFGRFRFEHPATRWYNLRLIAGADRYFPHNAATILDFFAAKVATNIRAGKRTLLIARKKHLDFCARELTGRLHRLGVGPVRIVTGDWDRHDLNDPRTLPLISYGISGVNRFEGHDAAYCLTGFYVSGSTIEATVHDLVVAADRVPVRLGFAGTPSQRRAVVSEPEGRESILPRLAQGVLDQHEANVVVQAVGRVRPFTKPREVITFQLGDLPEVKYHLEFQTLAAARAYFGIPTARQAQVHARAVEARRLRALGCSQRHIAEAIGASLSTVKRYLRQDGGHEISIIYNKSS